MGGEHIVQSATPHLQIEKNIYRRPCLQGLSMPSGLGCSFITTLSMFQHASMTYIKTKTVASISGVLLNSVSTVAMMLGIIGLRAMCWVLLKFGISPTKHLPMSFLREKELGAVLVPV